MFFVGGSSWPNAAFPIRLEAGIAGDGLVSGLGGCRPSTRLGRTARGRYPPPTRALERANARRPKKAIPGTPGFRIPRTHPRGSAGGPCVQTKPDERRRLVALQPTATGFPRGPQILTDLQAFKHPFRHLQPWGRVSLFPMLLSGSRLRIRLTPWSFAGRAASAKGL